MFASFTYFANKSDIRTVDVPMVGMGIAVFSGLSAFIAGNYYTDTIGQGGDGSVVAALIATYPAICYVFSVTFGFESFTMMKALGVLFALASCICFSM